MSTLFPAGHVRKIHISQPIFWTRNLLCTVSSTLLTAFSKTKTRLTLCPLRVVDIILVISSLFQ